MSTYAGQYGPVTLSDRTTGVPVSGAAWTVLLSDGVTAATLYTDRTKATTTSNSGTVGTDGTLSFFASPGRYVLNTLSRTYNIEVLADPAEPPLAHATTHQAGGTDPLPAVWSSDFVAGGDLLRGTGVGTYSRLALGAALKLLRVNTGGTDLEYVDGSTIWVPKSTVTTKGDLLVATASGVVSRRGVGTDGQVLKADSTDATGLSWYTLPSAVPANKLLICGPLNDPLAATDGLTFAASTVYYYRFRSTGSETLAGLSCYITTRGAAGERIAVGLYADSSGAPGARLAQSNATAMTDATVASPAFTSGYGLTSATDYWLAICRTTSVVSPTVSGLTMTARLAAIAASSVAKESGSALPSTATPVALAGTEVLPQVWAVL